MTDFIIQNLPGLSPVSSTGTPGVILPVPFATSSATVFGAANTQQEVQFVCPYTITIGHVTVFIGTGVAAATMGIAIYSADGQTKMTAADGFSVDASHTGAQRNALSSSITLKNNTTYWIGWTATTGTTLTCENFLPDTAWASIYNAATVRIGSSGTATSGGNTNSTIGTVSGAQQRIPVMVFD